MLLLIDHLGGLVQDNQSPSGLQLIDDLRRVFTDGPAVGIHTVVAADRVGAVPSAWQRAAGQKWLFGLADPVEFQLLGLGQRRFQPSVTGRGITAVGIEFQIATVPESTGPESTCGDDLGTGGPVPLRNFSDGVSSDELRRASLGERPWSIPIGFDTVTGAQAELTVHEGDWVLIAGPPRSGCSNVLAVVAWQVKSSINVAALASRKSCLHDVMQESEIFDDVEGLIAHLSGLNSAVAVLVDDSEEFDDPRLAGLSRDVQLLVVAGRAEHFRTSFGHWTRSGARSRTGLLLRPDRDLDGDLFGIRLPRSGPTTSAPGRAVLVVDGRVTEVQLAELSRD